MKEEISASEAETVDKTLAELAGSNIALESGYKVDFMKGGCKVKDDKAVLIYRYQITEKP
ncbi:MAG: hypothetical protein GT589_04040 [Peptoclostridium sp.]|uniref:hypothetical protein n=1 Tax=Peptoclostridium sp. TaxID=1904860 RepID=UPI00139CF47D|nr:hypothetical protein [Peptoclostridium sp.]MZQ75313.1 hypothetical protein [Peptoclostridium sp.]